jgi:hypothetical protein
MLAIGKLSYEQLVKNSHPTAFVDDDGEWVRIRVKMEATETCSKYKRDRTRMVTDVAIGSAGNEQDAWKDAAQNLGLIS